MRIPAIWLGSDESYTRHIDNYITYTSNRHTFLEKETRLEEQLAQTKLGDIEEEMSLSDYLADRMIEIVGNVGIVRISGGLVSEESFSNLWFGDTGYPTIMNAVQRLLEAPEVGVILSVWDTPGGDASGIYDLGTFLKDARKVKPIHAWTGTQALSAGYWGAACCESVRASTLGETGSIGAIAKFRSLSKYFEEEGIDTLIARSAPMKAILQVEEPIDDKKRAYLQEKVDKLHGYFVEHVKSARAKLRETPESKWARGSTFFAAEAIEAGLVDGPEISLSALVSKLQSSVDRAREKQTNAGMMMKKGVVLSDQVVAQLMSGVISPAQVGLETGEVTDLAETETKTEDDGATPVQVPGETDDLPNDSAMSVADAGLTAYLTTKVSELEGRLLEATLKAERADTRLAELSGLEEIMRPALIEATQRLQVALNQSPQDFSNIPSRSIVAAYHEAVTTCEKRFPVGRRSVSGDDDSKRARSLAELRLVSSGE